MPIIEVKHVTKEYQLGALTSLKQGARKVFARLGGHSAPERTPFKALDDVDFRIEQGEVVGIIGQNGAGKSTLLKLLARISVPTRGSIKVKGKIAPLIEVGAGLIGDLSGRENIFLNGAILGIPKAEITRKFDEIVAFAELEKFIDTPIKRYSSGMSVRLGFAIATSVDADILIVDEVLAVGDLAFQRKCFDRMEDMIKRQGKTVLLVSHNIRQVERLCSRAILLDHGKVVQEGAPRDVCNLFYERSHDQVLGHMRAQAAVGHSAASSTGELDVEECKFFIPGTVPPIEQIAVHDSLIVAITFRAHIDLDEVDVVVGFHTTDLVYITTANTGVSSRQRGFAQGLHTVRCRFLDVPLMPGVYGVRIGFLDRNARQMWYAENFRALKVIPRKISLARASTLSMVDLHVDWSFQQEGKATNAVA